MSKTVLLNVLAADGIAEFVGERIYPQEAPPNAARPYIVYSRIGRTYDGWCLQTNEPTIYVDTYEVMAVCLTDSAAEQLGDEIESAAKDANPEDVGSATSFDVASILPTNRTDQPETPLYRDERPSYLDVVQITIQHRGPV